MILKAISLNFLFVSGVLSAEDSREGFGYAICDEGFKESYTQR